MATFFEERREHRELTIAVPQWCNFLDKGWRQVEALSIGHQFASQKSTRFLFYAFKTPLSRSLNADFSHHFQFTSTRPVGVSYLIVGPCSSYCYLLATPLHLLKCSTLFQKYQSMIIAMSESPIGNLSLLDPCISFVGQNRIHLSHFSFFFFWHWNLSTAGPQMPFSLCVYVHACWLKISSNRITITTAGAKTSRRARQRTGTPAERNKLARQVKENEERKLKQHSKCIFFFCFQKRKICRWMFTTVTLKLVFRNGCLYLCFCQFSSPPSIFGKNYYSGQTVKISNEDNYTY